jgi:hypothetical protein
MRKIHFEKYQIDFVKFFNVRVHALFNQETFEEMKRLVEEFDHCYEIISSELGNLQKYFSALSSSVDVFENFNTYTVELQ